jgi:hypothetical protein
VTLADQHASVVDALCEAKLVHARLQAALEEVFGLESEHIVEFHARFVQHAYAHQSADQRVAFEQPPGVLFVQSQELSARGWWHVSEAFHA